jgi:hypothetical protein
MSLVYSLLRRSDSKDKLGTIPIGEAIPMPGKTVPIGIIVAAVLCMLLVISVCFLPTGTIAGIYDWIRRGFKPAPATNNEVPYVFFNQRLNEEAKQNR